MARGGATPVRTIGETERRRRGDIEATEREKKRGEEMEERKERMKRGNGRKREGKDGGVGTS